METSNHSFLSPLTHQACGYSGLLDASPEAEEGEEEEVEASQAAGEQEGQVEGGQEVEGEGGVRPGGHSLILINLFCLSHFASSQIATYSKKVPDISNNAVITPY